MTSPYGLGGFIGTPQPRNVGPKQESALLTDLQFPSPSDQTESQIKNWVSYYCEMSRNAPSELAFRNLINVLIPKPEFARCFMMSINKVDMSMAIVVLKSICLIHRQMLYAPRINPLAYEKLFRREINRWSQIERENQNQIGDYFRTPLIIRLINQYLELLLEKVLIVKEYGNIVNSAYVLQKNTIGPNNNKENSPLAKYFLARASRLFDKFSQLHSQLFNERNQLFEIRLTVAINLVEDQFLLMSLLSHLNLTFKVMYKRTQASQASSQNLNEVAQTIQQFD